MRKNLIAIAICSAVTLLTFTRCAKDATKASSSLSKTATSVKPDLLPGTCPYPCTDTRCKAYANGYCGTGSGTDTVAVVKNSANPQDTVGARHNAVLDAVLPTYLAGTVPTQANVWSNNIAYLSQHGYSAPQLVIVEDTFINRFGADTMTIAAISSYSYTHGLISQKLYTYINSLSSLATALPTVPTSTTYSSFASSVKSLETTILADATLSGTDKAKILAATSVARYSAEYWINYYNESSSGSAAVRTSAGATPNLASGGGPWFSWVKVLNSDVSGAIGGATAGALASVISGGTLSVPAAATGAVVGAAGNSVKKAADQILDHFFP